MASSISILVCTHQAPTSLDFLFDSLRTQEWQEGDELIVVDNGVDDERLIDLKAQLSQFDLAGIRAIYTKEEQIGLTAARIHGFSRMTNDWVALLDDDNELGADALLRLRQRIALNPDLGGICPRVEPIWETVPEPSVVMLGHDVLSFNTSEMRHAPFDVREWPGGVKGMRPPGGGMIVHRSATDAFIKLCQTYPFIRQLGHSGKYLGSGEDYILFEQVYLSRRPTAYDGAIRVRHRIPAERTTLPYLCRLFFRANYGFGLVALMIVGKALFLPSIFHAVWRLTRRLASGGKAAVSWKVWLAFLYALAGYLCGTCGGLMQHDLPRLKNGRKSMQ